jgi:hypothetical protein
MYTSPQKECGLRQTLHLTSFDQQKLRGALTSIVSGGSSNLLYFLLVNVGFNPVGAAVLALHIIGGVFAYTLDIVFAKASFKGKIVPYTDLNFRLKYLLKSFFSEMILRFMISIIIMSITYYFAYQSWIKFAEENKWTFRWYKHVYAIIMGIALYFLFNHVILFDYVYMETMRPIEVDITMIGIMILCVIAYSAWHLSRKTESPKEQEEKKHQEQINKLQQQPSPQPPQAHQQQQQLHMVTRNSTNY